MVDPFTYTTQDTLGMQLPREPLVYPSAPQIKESMDLIPPVAFCGQDSFSPMFSPRQLINSVCIKACESPV